MLGVDKKLDIKEKKALERETKANVRIQQQKIKELKDSIVELKSSTDTETDSKLSSTEEDSGYSQKEKKRKSSTSTKVKNQIKVEMNSPQVIVVMKLKGHRVMLEMLLRMVQNSSGKKQKFDEESLSDQTLAEIEASELKRLEYNARSVCKEVANRIEGAPGPGGYLKESDNDEVLKVINDSSTDDDNSDGSLQDYGKEIQTHTRMQRSQIRFHVNSLSLSSRRRRPENGGAPETDEDGRTALHRAAKSGDAGRIRALLDAGWNTRARDVNGQTPLHLALSCRKEAAAELLVNADSITDVVDNNQRRTPLHCAAESGFVNVMRILLAAGADASVKDRQERTPLHRALYWGEEAVAEVLLVHAPECGGPNIWGKTPLHLAAEKGLVRIVQFLVSRGARLQAKDRDGHCPLYYALKRGHEGVARVLLATLAWRDIEIHWEEMRLSKKRKSRSRGVRLLSECEAEMRDARVEGSRLSLRDLARRPPSRLARRLSERDLLTRDFPLFGDLLLVRLGEVRERRALEDRFLRCFPLLCRPLPTTCTDVLLACLTNDDLRHFARAAEL
ncbi:E3 ubiquitin-protein ligase mib1-like [Uloborus diversus]|uniref:E3 ubiquitin-protein ligase mib1-like n=1 Tax=Uloborus diversus TaxID=327109 RepID=UPI00240A82B0|nr:E3 ubiquitin-protein ligase mib1-like [Uloborus diversus]